MNATKQPPRVVVIEWIDRCGRCRSKKHRCLRCKRFRAEERRAA